MKLPENTAMPRPSTCSASSANANAWGRSHVSPVTARLLSVDVTVDSMAPGGAIPAESPVVANVVRG